MNRSVHWDNYPFPRFLTIKKKIAAHDTRGESVTIPEKQQPSCELSFNLCEAGEETKSTRNLRGCLGIASAKVMSKCFM